MESKGQIGMGRSPSPLGFMEYDRGRLYLGIFSKSTDNHFGINVRKLQVSCLVDL